MTHLEQARILIVGAGGIGCELLKNTVLAGFKVIEIVDLDTIELSNLNRQFLFRRKHIGRSKALVARNAALKLASPGRPVSIQAHFANIMDAEKFPLPFFKGFDLVLNALDNLAARQHVNSMCLACRVPLIESGTAGFLGQTSIILPRESECFDCIPKEPPKTFPVCTIRSTPSAFIHCVVWAKEFLFPNLYGPAAGAAPSPEDDGSGTSELQDVWTQEQEAFSKIRKLYSNPKSFFEAVYAKVCVADVEKLLQFKELWKNREPPRPLPSKYRFPMTFAALRSDDSKVWTFEQWIDVFRSSCSMLASRKVKEDFVFDKDDMETLNFVAAAANVRAHIFHIPLQSRFDIKAMAGNIIPAIATTNAIAAGTMIVHAKNILQAQKDAYCNAYITYGGKERVFSKERLCPPSPNCSTCSVDRAILKVNTDTFRLLDLIDLVHADRVARLRAAFPEREFSFDLDDLVVIEGARLLYDIDDDAGNSQKTLAALSITDSKFVRIILEGLRPLVLGIIHSSTLGATEYEADFDLLEPKELCRETEPDQLGEKRSLPSESESDSDLVLLTDEVELVEVAPLDKRTKLEQAE